MCTASAPPAIWKRPNARFCRLIAALKAGVPGAAVKDEITTLEARRRDLLGQLEAAPPPIVRLHPNIAEVYRRKIVSLGEALNDEHTRTEAAECVRALIEEIRLVPEKASSGLSYMASLQPSSTSRTNTPVQVERGRK